MTVQIHINGENAGEAIRELSELALHLSPSVQAPAVKVTESKSSRAKAAEAKKDDVKPAADPDPVESGQSEKDPIEEDPIVDSDLIGDDPVVTVEELRAKASEVAQSGKQAKVKELLTKFKAASISTVPEGRRNEFMKALEAL